MRVEFAFEMTDNLARAGSDLLVRQQLRGVTWPSALFWFLVSVGVFVGLGYARVFWLWGVIVALTTACFFLVLLLVLWLPALHRKRLERYLQQMADWPHRRVAIALTPDVIELTTPVASGFLERRDLAEVFREAETTVLLFKGGIFVPVPTASIPEDAWSLLQKGA